MSAEPVILVEGLGKRYLIRHQAGQASYRRFSEELVAALARPFRRRGDGGVSMAKREWFWALSGVNFDVQRGEAIGIIGRNGAGKSTLLKVLSRITEPTEGRVRVRGRVASLLEVGTGFHPELTGRENIFLNGTILGMTRREIQSKFDEIVAFAEIEKFLDTPVKRYSSGMYVRLAFAVAAHLEPEILIVDEVLAVGDLQFQKRCLGKMQTVASSGRTVLFVSHNMSAIRSLTQRAILLEAGKIAFAGASEGAIQRYANQGERPRIGPVRDMGTGEHTKINLTTLLGADDLPTAQYFPSQELRVLVEFDTDGTEGFSIDMILEDVSGTRIGLASVAHFDGKELPSRAGRYRCALNLGRIQLASGLYRFDITTSRVNVGWDHYIRSAIEFDVPHFDMNESAWDFRQSQGYGNLALKCAESPAFERLD